MQEKNKFFNFFSLVNSINRGQIEEVDMEGEEAILWMIWQELWAVEGGYPEGVEEDPQLEEARNN